jgi:hypothetical protein
MVIGQGPRPTRPPGSSRFGGHWMNERLQTRDGEDIEVQPCEECGALVRAEDFSKHGAWHGGGGDSEPQVEAEPLESQVERLARFIMENIPGEPSQSEGAIDTAIRLLSEERTLGKADWLYSPDLGCHIPCCTWLMPTLRRCGNGPLTGEAIVTGNCGQHGDES